METLLNIKESRPYLGSRLTRSPAFGRFAFVRTCFKICLALVFLAAVGGARAQQSADGTQLIDGLNAVVADSPITQQQVERIVGPDEQNIRRQYQDQPDLATKEIIRLREQGEDILVTHDVILHEFKESIKVPESILDDYVQDRIKERWGGDTVAMTKFLELKGLSLQDYKDELRDEFIITQMRLKYVPQPIISPRKVEDYYVAHRDDYKLEDQIKMRMIVLNKTSPDTVAATRERANEILSQIKGGAAFADLAKTYSDGSLRQDGGETGWEDLSVVNKTLADNLTALKPGQSSGVIDMPDAFYILLLEDRHPAHFKPLTDVRAQIERNLAAIETERRLKIWIQSLKNKTFVKYF
jgi:peptidyl-prolyl cis-trans isomerase SurA